MEKDVLKFKSKRSWFLISIVYLALGGAISIPWLLPHYYDIVAQISVTLLVILVLSMFTWAVLSTYYLLYNDRIIAVSGPFKIRIYYSQITDIKPSIGIWSSLALSLDRVLIKRGNNFFRRAYFSPQNKDIFIKELKNRVEILKQTNNK